MWLRISAMVILSLVAACSPRQQVDESNSQLHYIEGWSQNPGCGFRLAMQPLKVCVRGGSSQKVIDEQKNYTLSALKSWLGALRQVNQQVTDQVDFGCDNARLTMNIQAGEGTATGGPGRINIYASKQLGTHLHEWGHAFACLSDTYMGRQAGKCKPGHRESIMCWGEYGEDRLYDDDIEGIQKTFLKVFPFNPGSGGATQPPSGGAAVQELFLALAKAQAPTLYVSASKGTARVLLCPTNSNTSCRANTPGVAILNKLTTNASRDIFVSTAPVNTNAAASYVATAEDANGQPIVSRRFGFKARP